MNIDDLIEEWSDDCRDMMLACDQEGHVSWADKRVQRRLALTPGTSFMEIAAPGTEGKVRSLLERGRQERVKNSELSLRTGPQVLTYSFCARPDGHGGVLLLGSCLSEEHTRTLSQMQEAMDEVVSLNREVAKKKREIEERSKDLERAYRDLYESNKGVMALHSELADKADVLRRTSEVKSRVVANVSHEFRTPLHTILGLSKLLLDGVDGPLNDEQKKQIRYIRSSAEQLHELVNDLLDLAKVESGKAVLRPDRFTVTDLFSAIRGMLRPLTPEPHVVDLILEDPKEEIHLDTDQGKVSQVLRNLISNALKFTERGEVRVSASLDRGQVVFRVKDTGIGIAPENFDTIFEEFGQVQSPLQEKVKGTGLGLPLSRRLAELLGGTLTVSSEVGVGSTFTLAIPEVHPEAREFSHLAQRPLDPSKAPVMVVEDDRKTIFIYEKYLSMAGYQVVPARTVEDARKALETVQPAAIVLDVMLEGETTWTFLAELKRDARTSDIPVLVVTVTAKEQRARALGADEFWLKPVDQDRLLRKLRSLAGRGASTRVLVIDDDEKSRYLISKHLAGSPFELFQASTGPEGVAMAQRVQPHVILLDFLLRDVTAFDVLDDLKSNPRTRGIPVIVVTSHVLDALERKRLAAETEAIVPKQQLSRELAINRIRDALQKAGLGSKPPLAGPGAGKEST